MKIKTLGILLGVCGALYIGTEYIKNQKNEVALKEEQNKEVISKSPESKDVNIESSVKLEQKEDLVNNENKIQKQEQNIVSSSDPLKDIGKIEKDQNQDENTIKEKDFTNEETNKSFIELTKEDNELFFENTLQLKENENIKNVTKITFEPQILFSLKEKVEFNKQDQYEELADSLPPNILETNAQYNDKLSKSGPFKEEHDGGELIQEQDQLLKHYIVPFAHFEAETSSLKSGVNWLDFILTREILKNYENENFLDKSIEETLKENNLDLSKIKNEDVSKENLDKINQIVEKIISPEYLYELSLMKDKDNFDYSNKEYVKKINLEKYSTKTKILNFFIDKYVYLGGAHGMSYIHPINIDLRTKETVAVTDVLNFNNSSLTKINDAIFSINRQYYNGNIVLENNDIQIKKENQEDNLNNSLYKGNDIIKSQNFTFKDNKIQAEYEKYKTLSNLLKDALVKYRIEVENESVEHIKDDKEKQIALEDMRNATNEEYGNYEIYPSFNFFILDDGLTFVYQPYALLPYAYGFVELFVSYEDLIKNDLLTKDFLEKLKN